MVYVVSGFLFNNKTIRAWAKARNVNSPRNDAIFACELEDWLEEKGWNAFWPMALTWPRDTATLKESEKRKPWFLLVCREKKVSKKTLKSNPDFEIEMDDRDRQIDTWLRRQGFTRTRWVTVPDPCQEEPGSTRAEGDKFFDHPDWEDDDGWNRLNVENSQPKASGSSKASRHASPNRARPSNNESQSSTSDGSPHASNGSGHTLRSGKIIPTNRGDITSPTDKAHKRSLRSLRPRREPREHASKAAD